MIELFFLLGVALTGAKCADSVSQAKKKGSDAGLVVSRGKTRDFTLHDSGFDPEREVWWTRTDRFQIKDL